MKKLFTLLFAAMMFVACNNTTTEKVESEGPIDLSMTIINHTEQPMKWEQSYPDQKGVLAVGDTITLTSDETQSDQINVYPMPPLKNVPKDGYNPSSGNWGMQYGYDGYQKIARVYCCNACSKGRPTKTVQDTLTNWYYVDTYKVDPCVQTNTTNTVVFTVVEQPIK